MTFLFTKIRNNARFCSLTKLLKNEECDSFSMKRTKILFFVFPFNFLTATSRIQAGVVFFLGGGFRFEVLKLTKKAHQTR